MIIIGVAFVVVALIGIWAVFSIGVSEAEDLALLSMATIIALCGIAMIQNGVR